MSDDSNKRFSTNTDIWPDNFVKVCLNNYLTGQENGNCIEKLGFEVVVIKAQNSDKDLETDACSISIPAYIGL